MAVKATRPRPIVAERALRIVSALLIVSGLGVLVYLNVSDWMARIESERNISTLEARLDEAGSAERLGLLEQAELYNQKLIGKKVAEQVLPYAEQLKCRREPMMGYIEIPKISVRLPIYHGTADAELMSGVGHLEDSSLPIGGEGTRCVLLGHSGMANTRMLDDAKDLTIGDSFVIWVLNEPHAYEVYDVQTVLPEQVRDCVKIDPRRDLATLVTCTPYGINSHRLLVHAQRCAYVPETSDALGSVPRANERNVPLALAIGMVGASTFAGLAGRSIRRRREAEAGFRRVLGAKCQSTWPGAGPAHARADVRESRRHPSVRVCQRGGRVPAHGPAPTPAKHPKRGIERGASRTGTAEWKGL